MNPGTKIFVNMARALDDLALPTRDHDLPHTVVSKLITDRRLFWEALISNYRYRIALPEELIVITETDLWESQQKISHYGYRFSLEFQLISITDTDFELKTNQFCNHFGYNGNLSGVIRANRFARFARIG